MAALNLAHDGGVDVVLIQEPHIRTSDSRRVTSHHPGFHSFSPEVDWETNAPRVLTFVRMDPKIRPSQITPFRPAPPNALWIVIGKISILNIYRRHHEEDVRDILGQWTPPAYSLIAGDFNAHHGSWEPGVDEDRAGREVEEWATTHSLDLIIAEQDIGKPTHDRGHAIDLAFSNFPAVTRLAPNLFTGSDHQTLVTEFFPPHTTTPKNNSRHVQDEDLHLYGQAIQRNTRDLAFPPPSPTPEDLDQLTAGILTVLDSALQTVGRKKHKRGRPSSFWDDECRSAQTTLSNATADDLTEARREFRKIINQKKRAFFDNIIATAGPGKDIWNVMRWRNPTDKFQPPPLKEGDQSFTTPIDRATYLRDKLLNRQSRDDDISDSWSTPVSPEQALPYDLSVSLEQAHAATISAGNTTPGTDNITRNMLKAAWPTLGEHIRLLYQHSITSGYFPRRLRTALCVMIPKPKKKDYTTAKSWRPIALLSCLGKGLERLIARRIAVTALTKGVLPSQYFGALPKRSAVDLAACLIHDVENAIAEKQVASLLTLDVSGAFDIVQRNRMVLRLRQQGWPAEMVRWVESFLTDRTVAVRHRMVK